MFPLSTSIIIIFTFFTFVNACIHTLRIAHQERGILTLSFDPSAPANSSVQLLSTTRAGYQPGWLHSRGEYLYSVSRTHFPSQKSSVGGIFAFKKLPHGRLELSDKAASYGDGGVYVDVSPDGKTLSSANIDGSVVSILPLTSSGHFGEVAHIFHYNLAHPGPGAGDSQRKANPHQAVFNPSGDIMVVPDRGADRLYVYQVHSTERVEKIRTIALQPGTGPRHVVFSEVSQMKSLLLLVSELDNTINVFSFEYPELSKNTDLDECLKVTHMQRVSTLDGSSKRTKPTNVNLAAELALSHDKRFLYVSNRNTESVDKADTIGIYSFDQEANKPLRFLGLNSAYGKIPRHFSLSIDSHNRFLAVANQVSNNLFIIERDQKTGSLGHVVGNYTLGKLDLTTKLGPMAVIWD